MNKAEFVGLLKEALSPATTEERRYAIGFRMVEECGETRRNEAYSLFHRARVDCGIRLIDTGIPMMSRAYIAEKHPGTLRMIGTEGGTK